MATLFFPQLPTGNLAQYPVVKRHIWREVVSRLPDGTSVRVPDPGATQVEWRLRYEALSRAEIGRLAALFSACEGTLREFVFLDPCDNLLASTENLDLSVWRKGPLLALTGGLEAPLGGSGAWRVINQGTGVQAIEQQVMAPSDYQLCLSFWARAATPLELAAGWTSEQGGYERACAVSPAWRRFAFSGKPGGAAAPILVRLAVPAGASLDLFGPQLEAQLEPSAYRRTALSGGVYPGARFLDDELTVVAHGPEHYSADVRIGCALAP